MENSFISDFGIESSSELPVVPSVPIGLKKDGKIGLGVCTRIP